MCTCLFFTRQKGLHERLRPVQGTYSSPYREALANNRTKIPIKKSTTKQVSRVWSDHFSGTGRYHLQYKHLSRKGSGTLPIPFLSWQPIHILGC